MKKKLLSFVLSLCFLLPFAFALTACGGDDHTHEYKTTLSKDATSHWYDCKGEGCKEKKDKANHTYNVDTCSVCGYVDSSRTPATLQSMDTYFSGIKAEYLKDSFIGADNQTATFEELLDTQIDVLAQDILYRLTLIYGANNDNVRNTVSDYVLKSVDGSDYVLDTNQAKVIAQKLLSDSTSSSHSNHNINWGADVKVDLNCKDCIQSLINYTGTPNFLYYISLIDFTGAIEGSRTTLGTYDSNLSTTSVSANAWNWWNDSLANSTYSVYADAYKNDFKMAIAQILTNSIVTGVYNSDNYNNMLSSVAKLGYYGDVKTSLVNFIQDLVIGTSLVQKDNAIYNSDYFTLNNHEVGVSFISSAPFENGVFTPEEIANSPRLYKGYSIVVPAIVEQALNNTFEGTNISLYPKMSRTAYESTTTTTGFATEKAYQTITLMPKADAVTTKLVVKLTGVGTSIGQTIALDYDVVINATTYNGTKNVTLTSTEQEVEIELSTLTNGSKFGAYSGTTTSHISGNAFENNDFDADGSIANSDGNNYIKLDFNNTNNYSFIVTFSGMYNK